MWAAIVSESDFWGVYWKYWKTLESNYSSATLTAFITAPTSLPDEQMPNFTAQINGFEVLE